MHHDPHQHLPPWEIGRPQAAFVKLADEGRISGPVLDVGCGSGEIALFLASRGHRVAAIDLDETALAAARAKASQRSGTVEFISADALFLESLDGLFKTVIDCGCFHSLADTEREFYLDGLRQVVAVGGTVHLLVLSELEPGNYGPRRVTERELRDLFEDGFVMESCQPAVFEVRGERVGARAWLASFMHVGRTVGQA